MDTVDVPPKRPRRKLSKRASVLRQHPWIGKWEHFTQGELPRVSFEMEALLREVHAEFFQDVPLPGICFAKTKCIAYINSRSADAPFIVINQVFNRRETPIEVIRAIIKHELIHLVIRPRKVETKWVSHPPEFWEMEKRISPESDSMWSFTYLNFCCGLVSLPEDELSERGLYLKPRYAKKRMNDSLLSMEECLNFWGDADKDKKEEVLAI